MFDLFISLLILDNKRVLWEIQEYLDTFRAYKPRFGDPYNKSDADIVRELGDYYWNHVGGATPRSCYPLYEKGDAIYVLADAWDQYLERAGSPDA